MSYTINSGRNADGTQEVTLRWPKTSELAAHLDYVPAHFEVLEDETRLGEQNRDGGVHLTHYDRSTLFSYVWDGHSDHIEVSHGGYAEPVFATIPIDPNIVEEVTSTMYDDGDDHSRDAFGIFERHVIPDEDEEDEDPFAAAAACPRCGAEPESAHETSATINEVTGFGLGTIHVTHKEHFGDGDYTLVCSAGHEYQVPTGVEVVR